MNALTEGDLTALCRRHGLRLTGPRRVIMQVLSGLTDHPDVEELHRRITAIDPSISLATVYRTVNLLKQHGLLENMSSPTAARAMRRQAAGITTI